MVIHKPQIVKTDILYIAYIQTPSNHKRCKHTDTI
jgi:hypothetical protein